MTAPNAVDRTDRAASTRALIENTAEQLFAEQGVLSVSNRQISEAAGQGNNAAVGYHFGTKDDLIRAIVHRHAHSIELARERTVSEIKEPAHLREWVSCLVRPSADHLASLGTPTWYARFNAQVLTDPRLRRLVYAEVLESPSLHQIIAGIKACVPTLRPDIAQARDDMARLLMVHMFAERERIAAKPDTDEEVPSWNTFANNLIDAITALWLAPVSP